MVPTHDYMADRSSGMSPNPNTPSTSPSEKEPVSNGPPKHSKTLYKRFKSFLSRLFKSGKYGKPKTRRSVRKPVVYVFSPTEIDVSVCVTLEKDMEFTAVYPVVPIQKMQPQGEKIQWDVHTAPNGTLVERGTGLELSSLFWEADLNAHSPVLSRPRDSLPVGGTWTISDTNSVVLSLEEITGYLERSLLGLGLHTEARTSFITFWLPSFLRHKYIALRFMPQDVYSRIAPLNISPEPDVVTRIFMLFQGVRNLEAWPSAQKRALDDVSKWADIVGVNSAAAFNKDLSRVLEWGAMEIPT